MTDRAANWRDTDPRDPRNDRPRRLTTDASSNSAAKGFGPSNVSEAVDDATGRPIPNSADEESGAQAPDAEGDIALADAAGGSGNSPQRSVDDGRSTRNSVAELERENRWLRDIIYEYVGTDPENIDPDGPQ